MPLIEEIFEDEVVSTPETPTRVNIEVVDNEKNTTNVAVEENHPLKSNSKCTCALLKMLTFIIGREH